MKDVPASSVQSENLVFFQSYWLNAVKLSLDKVVALYGCIVAVNLAVIVGGTKPEHKALAAYEFLPRFFILEKIRKAVIRTLDAESAVDLYIVGRQKAVAGTDKM